MIEGLKIEVTSAELKEHLAERAEHHREKVEFYLRQVTQLQSGGVGVTGSSNDPVGSLQASARTHENRRTFFLFLAEHVISHEIYRLTQNDLATLEFIAGHLY